MERLSEFLASLRYTVMVHTRPYFIIFLNILSPLCLFPINALRHFVHFYSNQMYYIKS